MTEHQDLDQMTREEMARELAKLRKELASGPEAKKAERRVSAARREFDAELEFIGDFDIISAKGINISKTGIAFMVNEPLEFDMKIEVPGGFRQHRGRLVWVQSDDDGGTRLGLQFVELEEKEGF
jgi:hypothetical protein